MSWTELKYKCNIFIKGAAILTWLLLYGQAIHAQSNETTDTLQYSIDTSYIDPPDTMVVDEEATVTAEEDAVNYFQDKELTGGFGDSLTLRKLSGSMRDSLENDEAFWYANKEAKKKQPRKQAKARGGFLTGNLFQTLLWIIIIGCFASFLVIYLYSSNAGIFRKSKSLEPETDVNDTSDIFAINYQREIEKAIAKGDYRVAIRLMYLRLLSQLADRNVIQYKHDNTNFDYLLQLQPTAMYPDFFRLTRNYEYSWYGQFDVDRDKFVLIQKDFENFDRKL